MVTISTKFSLWNNTVCNLFNRDHRELKNKTDQFRIFGNIG